MTTPRRLSFSFDAASSLPLFSRRFAFMRLMPAAAYDAVAASFAIVATLSLPPLRRLRHAIRYC